LQNDNNYTYYVKNVSITESLNTTIINPGENVNISGHAGLNPDGTDVVNNWFNNYLDGVQFGNSEYMSGSSSWWNSSWSKRKEIVVNSSMVNATQTNFPMQLHINQLTNVNENGSDIRITDADGNQVPREIEWYNQSTGNLTLFFAGNISNETDTIFYMYYGNSDATEPLASSTYGSQAVWGSDTLASYLMSSTSLDSSSYAHNMTPIGDPAVTDIDYGKGVNYDTNDYSTIPIMVEISGTDVTNTIRVKPNSLSSIVYLMLSWYGVSHYNYWLLIEPDGAVSYWTRDGGESNYPVNSAAGAVDTSAYYTITVTLDTTNDTTSVWVDGIEVEAACPISFSDTDSYPLQLGRKQDTNTINLNSIISHVRVEKILRSNGYIATTHNNLNNPTATGTDSFYSSFGNEQTPTQTNETGFYNYTFTAPQTAGTYEIKVNLTNPDGIYGENTTTFDVRNLVFDQFNISDTHGQLDNILNPGEAYNLSIRIQETNSTHNFSVSAGDFNITVAGTDYPLKLHMEDAGNIRKRPFITWHILFPCKHFRHKQ